ncbi:Holliday junction resolvase RuvX [Lyticum sinuosum]|uniref:Holliday junction resolvase RuvX n=1 Tax=Lyticum sinuosum TaxID=1332059 RepID=A0AAE4VJP2_9RICK|nr:Holliday junction resolvase RuvX [Lyticum sinuosum]MDZ5761076.1 Holliday junction resolvase RuvX [Lyticum sinuosum]
MIKNSKLPYYTTNSEFVDVIIKSFDNISDNIISKYYLFGIDLGLKKTGVAFFNFSSKIILPNGVFDTNYFLNDYNQSLNLDKISIQKTNKNTEYRKEKLLNKSIYYNKQLLINKKNNKNYKNFNEIFNNKEIIGIIVGSAKKLDYNGIPNITDIENNSFFIHIKFASFIKKLYPNIVLTLYDERFTTCMAHTIMKEYGIKKRYENDDAIAASIILEGFYNSYLKNMK